MIWAVATGCALLLTCIAIIMLIIALFTDGWYTMKWPSSNIRMGLLVSCYDLGLNGHRNDCRWTGDLPDVIPGAQTASPPVGIPRIVTRSPFHEVEGVTGWTIALMILTICISFIGLLVLPLGQFLVRRSVVFVASGLLGLAIAFGLAAVLVFGILFNDNPSYSSPFSTSSALCSTTHPAIAGITATDCNLNWSYILTCLALPLLLIASIISCITPMRIPEFPVVLRPVPPPFMHPMTEFDGNPKWPSAMMAHPSAPGGWMAPPEHMAPVSPHHSMSPPPPSVVFGPSVNYY